MHATVFDEEVSGAASMLTGPDGQSPTMRMGLLVESNRHTALDSEVVFHEYTHGVTNRLVGGRLDQNSLGQNQSRRMGEGWSDFFALTFHNVARSPDKLVLGDWRADNSPDSATSPTTTPSPTNSTPWARAATGVHTRSAKSGARHS